MAARLCSRTIFMPELPAHEGVESYKLITGLQ
jgi:hypothetical protein